MEEEVGIMKRKLKNIGAFPPRPPNFGLAQNSPSSGLFAALHMGTPEMLGGGGPMIHAAESPRLSSECIGSPDPPARDEKPPRY